MENSILDFFNAHLETVNSAISSINTAVIIISAGSVLLSILVFVYNRTVINRKLKDFLEDRNTINSMNKAINGYIASDPGREVLEELIKNAIDHSSTGENNQNERGDYE